MRPASFFVLAGERGLSLARHPRQPAPGPCSIPGRGAPPAPGPARRLDERPTFLRVQFHGETRQLALKRKVLRIE